MSNSGGSGGVDVIGRFCAGLGSAGARCARRLDVLAQYADPEAVKRKQLSTSGNASAERVSARMRFAQSCRRRVG